MSAAFLTSMWGLLPHIIGPVYAQSPKERAMAQTASQSFENHARLIPAYHLGAFGIFVINLLWSIYRLVMVPSVDSLIALLLAVGFLLLFFYARVFALTVQDRVIRLEMWLRMRELLPADLHDRIG